MRILCAQIAFCLILISPIWGNESVDQFLAWNAANLRAIELSSPSPCLVARNLAIIHGAAFEAYNGVHPEDKSVFADIPVCPVEEVDAVLASLAAVWHTSKTFFPSYNAVYNELWETQLAHWTKNAITDRSVEYGVQVANACLLDRADDGVSGTITYIPKDEIGKWRRTPPRYRPPELPQWPLVEPFVLERGDQFRPPPPPALDSDEYAAAVEEVRILGRKRTGREEDQSRTIARFWSCFSYTATPSGHWNEIAGMLVRDQELDFASVARVFAVLNLTLADVGIATWDCKYHYEFWRPIQAIRQADGDGNADTSVDPSWNSELEAPPHPEYVSGHSAFSGAGARILSLLLGKDHLPFVVTSPSVPGVELAYNSLETCADEIGMSRLYGGIHYGFSNRAGLKLGREIADWMAPRVYPKIR